MKIYKHEYNSYRKEISIKEIEVRETQKLFIVEKGQDVWENRILKEDINKLQNRVGIVMFAFSPVKEEFIKAMIHRKEAVIQQREKWLKELVEEKEVLKNMLNATIQAVQNDL